MDDLQIPGGVTLAAVALFMVLRAVRTMVKVALLLVVAAGLYIAFVR